MNQLKILEILEANKDREFVQRIFNAADYPVLPNRDGSVSTHSMVWGEAGGRFFVYPTVILQEDQMMRLGPDTAFGHALRTGEFIEFDNMEDADEFSREYKKFSPFFEGKDEGILPDVIFPKKKSIWKDLNTGAGTLSGDSMSGANDGN